MKKVLQNLCQIIALFSVLFCLGLFVAFPAVASESGKKIDPEVAKVIEAAFPGAKIMEQRKEKHWMTPVIEVDIVTSEGKKLEVTLSEKKKIVEVEEE